MCKKIKSRIMEPIKPKSSISLRKRTYPESADKEGKFSSKRVKHERDSGLKIDSEHGVEVEEEGIKKIKDRGVHSFSNEQLKPDPEKGISYYKRVPDEERFRFLVDAVLLKEEGGIEPFESREPGCLKGGAQVFEQIISTLRTVGEVNHFLDKRYLMGLHEALFEPTRLISQKKSKAKKLKSAGKFRKKRVYIRVSNNFTRKGLIEAQDFYKKISPGETNLFQVAVYRSSSPYSRKIDKRVYPKVEEVNDYAQDKKCTVDFRPIKFELIESVIDKLLLDSRIKIASITDKYELIKFISELASKLDQIHPFENGNVRVIRGLIDSILMFYGFCPLVWENPNIMDFYSSEQIAEVMVASIQNTIELIECLESGGTTKGMYESSEADKALSVMAFRT